MPIKRTKSEKKKPRYIKVGKLKLSQEEWETQTALADYFKPANSLNQLALPLAQFNCVYVSG
jgi:hypothetical protein